MRLDEVSTGQFQRNLTQCLILRSIIYEEEFPNLVKECVEEHIPWLRGEYLDECNVRTNEQNYNMND